MLIFLVGQPLSLSPLAGMSKDQIFVSPFCGIPWHADSFAPERVIPQLNLTGFVHMSAVHIHLIGGHSASVERLNIPRYFLFHLFCKRWCTCKKRKRLSDQDTLLAQMSV